MIDLSEYAEPVGVALAEGSPCLIATANARGEPSLGYKGSFVVFDREHLAFWERSLGETLANLRENPRAAVLYRNRDRNLHVRFHGEAMLHESGEIREQIMARTPEAELNRDPERKGIGVLIRVDTVSAPGRGPLQTR
jgi:predicted pyridoxine 5'-phosphate oxidase superfamily flavin-nucleotide-binding protein